MASSDPFPRMLCCAKLGAPTNEASAPTLYDVKFWPWATGPDDHIFAVAASSGIFVCRPNLAANPPFEVLYFWDDPNDGASINSVAWTKDSVSGKPLLCAAGSAPKHITIIDIEQGNPVKLLSGHGRSINELMLSPVATNILASCSEDYTIRLWNLDREHAQQPCVAMLCGEGHRQPMLASTFHPNGKWILSGGMDTAVALWAVPPLHQLNESKSADQEPTTIYYPHFFSTEVHHNYVDSLAFYGDLIISRCARGQNEKGKQHEILLWKIDGFDSSLDPPPEPPIPEPGLFTRSSFPHSADSRGFQRLLTFSMPNTDRFYLRFALLHSPGMIPILSMGSQSSKFLFWDLHKLETGYDVTREGNKHKKGAGRKSKTSSAITDPPLSRLGELRREASVASDATRQTSSTSPSPAAAAAISKRSNLEDPFAPIQPHHTVTANTDVSNRHFGTYAMDWSPDGRWLLGVGDFGMMVIFHRDEAS